MLKYYGEGIQSKIEILTGVWTLQSSLSSAISRPHPIVLVVSLPRSGLHHWSDRQYSDPHDVSLSPHLSRENTQTWPGLQHDPGSHGDSDNSPQYLWSPLLSDWSSLPLVSSYNPRYLRKVSALSLMIILLRVVYYFKHWPASHQSCRYIAFFRDLIGKEGR